MPHQPNVAQIRFNNILTSLTAAVTTFEVVSESMKTPFSVSISNTIRSLLAAIQTVKKNRDDFTQMLEQIHELLYAVIRIHLDMGGELPPTHHRTLHKIHTFVEARQEKSRIMQFFRQGEINTLLKSCHAGLEQALKVFKIEGVQLSSDMTQMQRYARKTHQEVLDMISSLSSEGSSDGTSFLSRVPGSVQSRHVTYVILYGRNLTPQSSNSLSLLPSEPKIFHGRESEVSVILHAFQQGSPRIVILGGGGMGKTSLARAVLHHLEITARYEEHRFFVACDTTSTSVQLAALIGAHLGLKPGKDLTQPVIHYFPTVSVGVGQSRDNLGANGVPGRS
ncbi:hypothetical protein DFH09DRAFT_1105071 [Mycena vulgaris]|nr:hypothetical protein DFH09DRAFT_1105071 [Mycena vulgaris]